jgi:uncharacterized protein with GYD domain
MATYIMLVNYTEYGIRNIKDSPKRTEAVKKLAKKMGGAMERFYLTMGGPDIVAIFDFPNDETAAKFALTVGAGGAVRTTTLKAFNEAEYGKIVRSVK